MPIPAGPGSSLGFPKGCCGQVRCSIPMRSSSTLGLLYPVVRPPFLNLYLVQEGLAIHFFLS